MAHDTYSRRAKELLEKVLELDDNCNQVYDEERINRSIVFTRHDLVLVVSHLWSVNRQLHLITWLLAIGFLGLALLVAHSY